MLAKHGLLFYIYLISNNIDKQKILSANFSAKMIYDLSIKEDRKRFIKRANDLLDKMRTCVSLTDESTRTLNQNSYIHVLFRIMADYTGESEEYAKQVYFKELANPDIFVKLSKDPITKKMIKYVRSSSEVSVSEMGRAIDNFIIWAAENGVTLPEAQTNADGTMSFASQQDENAFHQAERLIEE